METEKKIGAIMSENAKSRYKSSFDDMLAGHKEVRTKRRNIFSVLDPDEEGQENDRLAKECDKIEEKESNIQLKS